MTTVRLKGFRELERALMDLPKATARNVLIRQGKAALEPMADAAARMAPKDEGLLAFSVDASEKRTRRAKTGFNRRDGVQIAMGPASGVGTLEYASFVEFGTVDTPAQPYMRPAWDGGAVAALEVVKQGLGAEIAKAAARLAKRQAKTGG